jgi:hypothetical protein
MPALETVLLRELEALGVDVVDLAPELGADDPLAVEEIVLAHA